MKTRVRPPIGSTKREAFSIPSLLAVVAALLSFVVTAGWGMLLAVIAMVSGAIGCALALSPRTRGGVVSLLSVVAGGFGIVAAFLRLIF